jgi:hypothetical protein
MPATFELLHSGSKVHRFQGFEIQPLPLRLRSSTGHDYPCLVRLIPSTGRGRGSSKSFLPAKMRFYQNNFESESSQDSPFPSSYFLLPHNACCILAPVRG